MAKKEAVTEKLCAPESIAIIMDGNGRWAKKRLMPRSYGHRAGAMIIERVLTMLREYGVHYVTLYAFSTENWKRPKEEVDTIMELVCKYIDELIIPKILKGDSDFAVRFIGDKSVLPERVRLKCEEAEAMAAERPYICNIALNYGGREEILHAARALSEAGLEYTEENFSKQLYTANIPDPAMLIRTGGDLRISNFLLWQSAYTEIVVIDTLWPDFDRKDIEFCIREFNSRKRRFGGLDTEDKK